MRRLFVVGCLLLGLAAIPRVRAGASDLVKRQDALGPDDVHTTSEVLSMAFLASGLTALSLVSLLRRRKP